jgi:hypothetical protein
VPQVETGNLQKLGEEFRKACEDANMKDQRSSFLPPLEHLAQLIPQIFQEESAAAPAPAQAIASAVAAASHRTPPQESRDPVLARAMAHAKVQAALAKGKASAPQRPSASSDLASARAAARDQVQAPQPQATAKKPITAPVIRKFEFPRIDKGT